jgi:hypothetical protein
MRSQPFYEGERHHFGHSYDQILPHMTFAAGTLIEL